MNRFSRICVVILLLIHVAAHAQNIGTGLYSFGSFDSRGFDIVNLGNLNIHFSIPIFSKQGRGLPFTYAVVYEGLIWSPVTSGASTTWVADQDYGFRGQLDGSITGYLTDRALTTSCGRGVGTRLTDYVYHDPFGKNHAIPYYPGFCGARPVGGTAPDGSGYAIDSTGVLSHFGQIIAAPLNPSPSTINSGSITDSNGNMITNNGNGTFTDTTGATVLTISGNQTSSSPLTLTYPVTNQSDGSTTASAHLFYKSYTIQTNFQCSGITEAPASSANLVDSIQLGDGSTYSFTYESTPGVAGAVTGRIASVTLPAGGVITYAYSGGCNGTSGINADGTVAGLTRTTTDGTRTYTRSSVSSISTITNVQDEKGNQGLYTFTATSGLLYETHRIVYSGNSSSGSVLMEKLTCYNNSSSNCDGASITLPFVEIDSTESYNGGSQKITKNRYTGSGSLLSMSSIYDGSTLLTQTTYQYTPLGKPVSVQVTDGSLAQVSWITYNYDETTPTATSGIPQHIAVSAPRGNLTTIRAYYNDTDPLITTASYYDTGMPQSVTTPNGVTTYNYDQTQTFITQTTLPLTISGVTLATAMTNAPTSGALLTATGMNAGQTTSISTYDPLLRPQTVTQPNGSIVTSTYSPTQTTTTQTDGGGQSDQQSVLFDSYGRLSREETFNGQATNSYYQTDTCYDSSGFVRYVSLPYQGAGFTATKDCSKDGISYTYDALGRRLTSTNADGTAYTSYYSRAIETTDVNGNQKILQYDLLGRLSGVCEISSITQNGETPTACGMDISGTGFITSYSYNMAAHSMTITQGSQVRTIQTDALGRTTSITEPERGNTTYTYSYNNTGLVVLRTRPRANQQSASTVTQTTYQYDAVGRIVNISYNDGLTPSKSYYYDVLPTGQGWATSPTYPKGQLVAISSGTLGTSLAESEFSYDLMGNATSVWNCGPSICGGSSQNTRGIQSSYDLRNRLVTEADPTSGSIAYSYSPSGEVTSIANQSYELAGPVGTASLISGITNGPYGPISYALGNGLDAVRSYDSLGRNNGGWICSGSMSDYCAGGAQLYGYFVTLRGAQIASICDTEINQCQNHRYDSMNRLVAVNGTQSSFTFTYDRWGNRLSQSTNSGIGSSPNGAVNPATNQVASLPYDAAGNQESDGIAHTFQYDADGNLVAVDGGNTASYVYDALNRRVQATTSSGSVEYSYDAMGRRISAWQASSNFGIEARMYWGMSQIAFRNGPTYFDHQNYLGTERLRTDSVGAVATTEYSLAYGDSFTQTTSVAGSDGDNEQYAGQEHDSESGTEHAQFRQYSSSLGRWLSPDPYDGSYDLTDPQSLDRYTYVRDNPLNAKDPTGLQRQGPSGNGCDTEEYDCGTDLPGTDGQFTDLVGIITVTNDQGGEYQYDPGTYNSIMSGESDLAWSGSSAYIDAGGNWYYTGVNVYETFFNASVGPSINPFGGGAPTAPNNGQKNQPCSVLDPNCKKPSKLLQYVTFLGCEFNSDIEQLTDEEDAQHPSQIPIVFSAIATVGGLTGKVPGWAGITGAVTGGIYTIGIAAKSNQECTESVYGH